MVKGEIIQQRGIIHKPNVNYRALGALNCSMIKLFDSDPVKFYEQFKLGKRKREKTSTSLIIGDIVDFFLLDCKGEEEEFTNRFDEKFALYEGTKGSGQAFILADALFEITQESLNDDNEITVEFDTRFQDAIDKVQADGKYKGKAYDKILEDFYDKAYSYFQSKMENLGKTVVDVSLLDKAKRVAETLKNDEFTRALFCDCYDDMEHFSKYPIEWEYGELKCKSELDLIHVDHGKKVIYPRDLKTTYDNESFDLNYLRHKYYLQAGFYQMAVEKWAKEHQLGHYKIEPMEFIVGDTSANNRRPIRYQLSELDMKSCLEGFSLKGSTYKGVRQLIDEIIWSENNNTWDVSKTVIENKGILQLGLKYD